MNHLFDTLPQSQGATQSISAVANHEYLNYLDVSAVHFAHQGAQDYMMFAGGIPGDDSCPLVLGGM